MSDRRAERYELVVEVTLSSGHNFWTGLTRNISEGGLFVETEEPLPVGSIVRFEFRLLPHPARHSVTGEVRWVRSPEVATEELPPGMGVKLETLPPDLSESIQKFMAHQRDSLFFDEEEG